MQKIILLLLVGLFIVSSIQAQTPTPSPAPAISGIKANLASGEVVTVSQAKDKISLKTADGDIDVLVAAATSFKRVPPDNPSLKAAVDSNLSEIGEGDKILVTGAVSPDKKTIPAKAIYLMTKSDISKKLTAERELWRTRGVFGRVVSVDFKTQNVTIASRTAMGETNVVLSPKENAEYLRYAPDSSKFSEAIASSLAEIKVGDQLRALGDKATDGLSFKAERYVSGSFKTVAGKVTAIDVAKNEITIEDTQTKKPVVIVVNSNTFMKRFPAEQAQMIAQMMAMRAGGGMQAGGPGGTTFVIRPGQGNQPNGQTQPTGNQPTATNGQAKPATTPATAPNGQTTPPTGQSPANGMVFTQGGAGQPQVVRGGRGAGDIDEMIERLPVLTIAELKVGDTIGVSSTIGSVPNRYTAIKLVSGVEPFLNMPQMPNMGGGRGNQSPNINIPGLDGGFGNP